MYALLFLILGSCLGSFYLVLGKRMPKGEKVVNDRSRCDSCHHTLAFYDLVPFFSYIFLGGKCRYCHKPIGFLHFFVETICGLIFMAAYLYYGIGYDLFMFLIIFSLLVIIYVTDFTYFIIEDIPLVVAGILVFILKLSYYSLNEALSSLLTGLLLFATMYLIKIIGDKIFKRESLGGGDIKLSFVIGMILGFQLGLTSLILSAFLALPYCYAYMMVKKNNEVPFGPFLISSLLVVFMFSYKFLNLLDLIFTTL